MSAPCSNIYWLPSISRIKSKLSRPHLRPCIIVSLLPFSVSYLLQCSLCSAIVLLLNHNNHLLITYCMSGTCKQVISITSFNLYTTPTCVLGALILPIWQIVNQVLEKLTGLSKAHSLHGVSQDLNLGRQLCQTASTPNHHTAPRMPCFLMLLWFCVCCSLCLEYQIEDSEKSILYFKATLGWHLLWKFHAL